MRKLVGTLLIVFIVAFVIGVATPPADAGPCYYKCSCDGTPLRCCLAGGVEKCKVTTGFACPGPYSC